MSFEGDFVLEYVRKHYPRYAGELQVYRSATSFGYELAHPDKPSLPFGVTLAAWDREAWCLVMAEALDKWLDDRTESKRLPWQVFSAYA